MFEYFIFLFVLGLLSFIMEFVELIKSPRVENVFLKRRSHQYVEGTLCVTGHHLIFSSRTEHKEELIVSVR